MKKYLNIFRDPRIQIGIPIFFFLIALINTWAMGANSYAEMAWWAKGSIIISMGSFAFFFLYYFVYKSLIMWTVSWIKGWFNKED